MPGLIGLLVVARPIDRQCLLIRFEESLRRHGSKALAKAVRVRCGVDLLFQHCLVQKLKPHYCGRRNVLDHLPPRHQRRWAWRLEAAWNMKDYAAAKQELERTAGDLAGRNPSVAACWKPRRPSGVLRTMPL